MLQGAGTSLGQFEMRSRDKWAALHPVRHLAGWRKQNARLDGPLPLIQQLLRLLLPPGDFHGYCLGHPTNARAVGAMRFLVVAETGTNTERGIWPPNQGRGVCLW